MLKFSPKAYLALCVCLLTISLALLCWTLITVNPEEAGVTDFALFYAAVYIAAMSAFTLLVYVFRVRFSKNRPLRLFARVSMRQGALFAALVVAILFLQSIRALTMLSVGLLVISLTLLEVALLAR